jgi:ribosomal protein L14
MALKFVLDSLEGLDEAQRELYSKHTDGKYYLEVEGAVAKSKVDEFRENNINLNRQLEELQDKYGNIDVDKYNELLDKAAQDDGKKRIAMDKVDEIVAERTQKMKEEYENQIGQLKDVVSSQSGQLDSLLIDGAVRQAATEAKVRPGAIEDVILRAKQTFKVVDGNAVAHDSKGNVVYGKDGSTPLSTTEWLGGLKKNASHLFETSTGGGAGGGDKNPSQPTPDSSSMSPLQKIAAGMSSSE